FHRLEMVMTLDTDIECVRRATRPGILRPTHPAGATMMQLRPFVPAASHPDFAEATRAGHDAGPHHIGECRHVHHAPSPRPATPYIDRTEAPMDCQARSSASRARAVRSAYLYATSAESRALRVSWVALIAAYFFSCAGPSWSM